MNSSKSVSKIEELREKIEKSGVRNVDHLAVFVLGANEQVMGEVWDASIGLVNGCRLMNPKRLIRIQQMTSIGMSISFMLGDFDLIEAGEMTILDASCGYWICDQSDASQEALLGLYSDYLNRKSVNQARAAGLQVPDSKIITGAR